MATENTLRLRAIQPRAGQARSVAPVNEWRRFTRKIARDHSLSRRRVVRIVLREDRVRRMAG